MLLPIQNLRTEIKNILSEMYGISIPIDKMADSIAETTLKSLSTQLKTNQITHEINRFEFVISPQAKITEDKENPEKELYIEEVILRLVFNKDFDKLNTVISGKFNPQNVKSNTSNNRNGFNIEISIELNWDFQTNIFKDFSSVLAHELHHAYDHIIRLNKKSISKEYNKIIHGNDLNMTFLVNKNPLLKEFIKMFYLSLPEETNARVQQSYNLLKNSKYIGTKAILDNLYETQPWQDAKNMCNYDVKYILSNISRATIQEFINLFNNNLKKLLDKKDIDDKDVKYYNEPKQFFNFWRLIINRKGIKLVKKILKSIGSSEVLPKAEVGKYLNMDILQETMGYIWDACAPNCRYTQEELDIILEEEFD